MQAQNRVPEQRNGFHVRAGGLMDNFVVDLSDADLIGRLTNFSEDHFVELETCGDHGDWLKTVVAFANSTPIGYPAVLFIGVKNDGTPEGNINLDSLQKTLTKRMTLSYRPYTS
jgi:hypothetical protein